MKLLWFVLALILAFSPQIIFAQSQASGTGKVAGNKPDKKQKSQTEFDDAEELATDFKNFKFTDNDNKEFQLKNGVYVFTNPKTKMQKSYEFRNVFYFDITGDEIKDAVVHILADNCEMCETKSVFYLFTAKDKKLQPIWKIFTGAGANCGLKDVLFKPDEIVLETFGNCIVKDSLIVEDNLLKKTDVSTKFIFNLTNGQFVQNSKENFPFDRSEIMNYRTQIKFGV